MSQPSWWRGGNSQVFRSEYLNPSLGLMRRNTSQYWWKSISEVLPSNSRSCSAHKTTCSATCLWEITALPNQHSENKPQIETQKKQNCYWNVLNASLMGWRTIMGLVTGKLWMELQQVNWSQAPLALVSMDKALLSCNLEHSVILFRFSRLIYPSLMNICLISL